MACFVEAIVVAIVVGSIVRGHKELEIDKDENIEPFALLCRIYNVAKNPPINYVDLHEAANIVNEIDALNNSLVEPKWHNETEEMGNGGEAMISPGAMREAAVAQLSLNQITQKAHTILEEIKRINVTESIDNVKTEFNKVIFGENGDESELDQSALSGVNGRVDACGKPGLPSEGLRAGKNLVVDFFCLCAQRPDGVGANQVCGFYVGSNRESGQLGWNETGGPSGSSTMWASIKGGCGKHMEQHPESSAEARHILDQFLKHLETGGVYRWGEKSSRNIIVLGSGRKEGMLGTSVGTKNNGGKDILCDGRKGGKSGESPGGICVYYGQASGSWEEKIDWLKQFKTALASVDYANNQTATVQRSLQKLQMLQNRAEEIYETTKVISEVQKPVVLASLQNAGGNITAYNATRTRSYSYRPNHYLIPAMALLLL
ncbi:Variant surface glycoprotein [Trypanosoma congolense IL3000]|uniref:Variant surface glycoprotein n=1 Tax=Trypanosoma congolense (strain IL3000) TaxID=1068625 RepID=F9WGW6_TRYCI|nr:Variant surface glycoprotein [Trypanosoma congolense IL3000]